MTTYKVSIPDNKNSFFLEFLELIGARYEKKGDDSFQLSAQQKKELDKRLKASDTDFVPARTALKKLREKHGL